MFGFLKDIGGFAKDTIRGMGHVSEAERASLSPEALDRLQAFRGSQAFGKMLGDAFSNNAPVQSRRRPLRQMQAPIMDQPQGPAFGVRTLGPSNDERRRMLADMLRRY